MMQPRSWSSDYWLDCPTCGPDTRHLLSGVGGGKPPTFHNGWCSISTDDFREVKTRNGPAASKMAPGQQCGGQCLAGKFSCDCRCKGQCHGRGACTGGH